VATGNVQHSPSVYLACVGNANDPDAWSAIPFHFLEAGKAAGLITAGLPLNTETRYLKTSRYAWNGLNVLLGQGRGGFQYSSTFLENLWRSHRPAAGSVVINHFQIYPRSIRQDTSIEKWHYIDGTLRQLVDHYEIGVSPVIMRKAIAEERENYHSARGVIAMSRYGADSVIKDYGVDPSKVHVAVPGANISESLYAQYEPLFREREARPVGEEIKLLIIGKDWQRKGIDRLLKAFDLARSKGLKASLSIVGCNREELPAEVRDVAGVTWTGFISRRTDSRRFFEMLTAADVGLLVSRAEFAGIAVREYLAVGMPVIATRAGGCEDMCDPECCRILDADVTPEAMADLLLTMHRDRPMLEKLRALAAERRRTRLWASTVEAIRRFWPHPVA
jgi:glycosyltransferase involved in cell wall biosynthesis